MFVSDRLLYLELHKTGCSHILRLLGDHAPGEKQGKHNRAAAGLVASERLILGSIRDPWAWYLSLWSYGCGGQGTLRAAVTQDAARRAPHPPLKRAALALRDKLRSGQAARWQAAYADVEDPACFRAWLGLMHGAETRASIGEGYARHPLSAHAGLLTYRYLRLFCTREGEDAPLLELKTPDDIAAFHRQACFVDAFIRNEALEDDFLAVLPRLGVEVTAEREAAVRGKRPTNVSSRKKGVDFYYDAEAVARVAAREALIIARFGYEAPKVD